jgi:hypothetical protein
MKKTLGRYIPTRFAWRLEKAYRVGGNPAQFVTRRNLARRLPPSPVAIDWDQGYLRFGPDFYPRAAQVVAEGRAFFESFRANGRLAAKNIESPKTGFLVNLLEMGDLETGSEFVKFALSNHVLSVVARYMGELPRLRALNLWWSPPNDSQVHSQLFHTDREDVKSIKVFLNIEPVGPENGPFTLLSAIETTRLVEDLAPQLRHPMVGALGRVDDDTVFRHFDPRSLVKLEGPAGAGAFVDTCRCLHFGSRRATRDRLILMLMFNSFYAIEQKENLPFDTRRYATDPIRASVLGFK